MWTQKQPSSKLPQCFCRRCVCWYSMNGPFVQAMVFFEPLSQTLPSAWLLNGLMARRFQMCFLLLCGQQQPPIEFCQRSFITFLFACEHRCPRSNFTLIFFFFFHLGDVLIYWLLLFFYFFSQHKAWTKKKKNEIWQVLSFVWCFSDWFYRL